MITPAERMLREHLANGVFSSEIGRKWGRAKLDWPHVYIAVLAAAREGAPDRYWLKFECTNYPNDAPTAVPWDMFLDAALPVSKWPGGTGSVHAVFRPKEWRADALYLSCDRIAIQAHPDQKDWGQRVPGLAWDATKDITLYLNEVYSLLHSESYTGLFSA